MDTRESAIQRAQRIWGDAALHARHHMREVGVEGTLRTMDELASGRRGVAVPKGLATFAMEMASAGIATHEIERTITIAVMQIVRSVTTTTSAPTHRNDTAA